MRRKRGRSYKHTSQGAPFPGGAGIAHADVMKRVKGKRIKRGRKSY